MTAESPQGLRVVFFDHVARMSGAEISMLSTVSALQCERFVVLGEQGPLVSALNDRGIPTRVLPLPDSTRAFSRRRIALNLASVAQPLQVLAYAARLAALINRLEPDVVVTNSMKSHVILSAARPLLKAPLVFHLHDRVSTDFMSAGGVRLEQALIRRVPRGIIANSESTMATAPAARRHAARRVIGGPIEPLPDGLAAMPARSGAAKRFGMVGRISPWKGQDLAIRAFARAFPDGDETFDVVGGALFGEDEYRLGLEELVTELGLQGRVRFAGHVSDVYARMRGWDVLVHASVIPEPFGLVVAQGMLAGLPVIAAGEGGPAEMIQDEVTGYLVPPRDVEALATTLRRVQADEGGRARVGRAAATAAEVYLPQPTAAAVLEVLRAAAGRPSRPAARPTAAFSGVEGAS